MGFSVKDKKEKIWKKKNVNDINDIEITKLNWKLPIINAEKFNLLKKNMYILNNWEKNPKYTINLYWW